MKRLLQLIGVVVLVLLIREGMNRFGGPGDDPQSRRFLKHVADNANKQLPRMIDRDTELTKVDAGKALLIYHHRLVNVEHALFERYQIEILNNAVKRQVCASAVTRQNYLDKGVRVRMTYADKKGQPLTSVIVSSADCQGRTS